MVQYKVYLVDGESHLLHYCPGSKWCPVLYNIGQVSYSFNCASWQDGKKYTIFYQVSSKKRVSDLEG